MMRKVYNASSSNTTISAFESKMKRSMAYGTYQRQNLWSATMSPDFICSLIHGVQPPPIVTNRRDENSLLHSQLAQLADAAPATGAAAEGGSTALLAAMRREKELLSQKNQLLTIEARRLQQQHTALTRQHSQVQGDQPWSNVLLSHMLQP